jgi:spore maturation protein CgeB
VNLNLANASTTGRPVSRWRRLLPGSSRLRSQIKGRNFEIPGCGAFLLTDPAENLGEYYHLDREVATFDRPRQLPQRIRFYLEHEAEREAIATAGHARTLAEHTYERRFSEAFAAMGLMTPQSTAAHGE